MKTVTPFLVMLSLMFVATGCQTAPEPAPRELTEEEQRALFVNGPQVPLHQSKSWDWEEIGKTTGLVILAIPIVALVGLCESNAHFSTGK